MVTRVKLLNKLAGLIQSRIGDWGSAPCIAVLGALVLFLGLTQGCRSHKAGADEPALKASADSVTIPTNAPQLGAITVEPVEARRARVVALSGRLIWNEDATVRVFTPFAGIVQRLLVQVNDPVKKGERLAEIRSPDFGQALADARKAESDFRRAERSLIRVRDLAEHGAAPRKDVESAEADFANAQAEKDRTRTRLEIYGASVDSTNQVFLLPSPLDGVVVEKNVTPGQEIRPDQILANAPQFTAPLFTVTDPSKLWIQIDATEADLPYLRPGRDFAFVSRAFPDQTFTGRVDVVSEFIDPNTRTIKVRGSVENSGRLLKAEMFVNVSVPAAEDSGASVPSKAVFLKGEKHYVFVENEPGQFMRKEVQIGPEHDGRVVILAGMQPGQRVVTDGCLLLQQSLHD
jgi:cobalt-zinc-cadmium efflux system membrane fusion protein